MKNKGWGLTMILRIILITAVFAFFLVACFSGEDEGGEEEVISVTSSLTLTAAPDTINADGASSSAITVIMNDATGEAVASGTSVTFTTTLGTFPNGSTTYQTTTPDDSGSVTVSLISGTTTGTARITATSNGVTQTTSVEFTSTAIVSETASIELTVDPNTINADGISSSAITATLEDASGAPVAVGTSVTFTTTLGTFPNGSTTYQTTTPDSSGTVKVSLISSTTTGTADITVTSSGVTQTTSVVFTGIGIPASLSLGLSQITVKSDNSNSTTITATVLDRNNAIVEGISVLFGATDGELSASTVPTDASGDAIVTFSSGTSNKSNRVATVTATVSSLQPKQIPIQVTGTTVELSSATTNLEIGGVATTTLTIKVQDAYPKAIYDASVTLSIDPSSTGAVTLSPSTGNTDVTGSLEVDVTGTAAGEVTVIAESMGATATKTYTVGVVGNVFLISSPTEDPYSLPTNTDLTVIVNAPQQTQVQFSTTLGTWDGGTEAVVTKPVSGGLASAALRSGLAGTATVQVFDADDASTTDSMTVAISAPSSEASQLSLQVSASVVAPSTGDIDNTVTLIATVTNASDQVVGGAPVSFSILNPTGGGESISPVIVYSNSTGEATSTFTSGSLSTDSDGVTVTATVVNTSIQDSVKIVIGGTAGSVAIGQSTGVYENEGQTTYSLPMSVIVADSNGNAVSGAEVSLSAWPAWYRWGFWQLIEQECYLCIYNIIMEDDPVVIYKSIVLANEDVNRNLVLDPGEEADGYNDDGELTPPNSAAGTLPATVVTDENGVANFNLEYLQAYGGWICEEITASTYVYGTEYKSTYRFWLGVSGSKACDSLIPSPFNDTTTPPPEGLPAYGYIAECGED